MRVYSCGSDFPDIRIVTFTKERKIVPQDPLPSVPASVSRQPEPAIWGRARDRTSKVRSRSFGSVFISLFSPLRYDADFLILCEHTV